MAVLGSEVRVPLVPRVPLMPLVLSNAIDLLVLRSVLVPLVPLVLSGLVRL